MLGGTQMGQGALSRAAPQAPVFESTPAPPGFGHEASGLPGGGLCSVAFEDAAAIIDCDLMGAAKATFDARLGRALNSRLAASGAAGEIAFVWPGRDVRLTIDPAPDAEPRRRLAFCTEAVKAQLTSIQMETAGQVQHWAEAAPLRYGGWLGVRRKEGRITEKLYVEVPGDSPWSAWEHSWAGAGRLLGKRDARPVMIGLDPRRPGIEIYQHLNGLCRRGLNLLLRRFGFETHASEIISTFEALTERTIRFDLPSDDLGFSVSFAAPEVPTVFTLYSISEALLGPAARARAALLGFGRARGWAMEAYANLSAPDRCGVSPHHGLIGLVLAPNTPMALTATLALDLRSTS